MRETPVSYRGLLNSICVYVSTAVTYFYNFDVWGFWGNVYNFEENSLVCMQLNPSIVFKQCSGRKHGTAQHTHAESDHTHCNQPATQRGWWFNLMSEKNSTHLPINIECFRLRYLIHTNKFWKHPRAPSPLTKFFGSVRIFRPKIVNTHFYAPASGKVSLMGSTKLARLLTIRSITFYYLCSHCVIFQM